MVLYNLLGDQVGDFALMGRRTTLRTLAGTLPKGVYFCSLLQDGLVLRTERLVKQ